MRIENYLNFNYCSMFSFSAGDNRFVAGDPVKGLNARVTYSTWYTCKIAVFSPRRMPRPGRSSRRTAPLTRLHYTSGQELHWL